MDTITIGGWNVRIEKTHKMTRTDADGFTFGMRFCIGAAHWNNQPVYFCMAGTTGGNVADKFNNIEEMRAAYDKRLKGGWIPA